MNFIPNNNYKAVESKRKTKDDVKYTLYIVPVELVYSWSGIGSTCVIVACSFWKPINRALEGKSLWYQKQRLPQYLLNQALTKGKPIM